MHRCESRIDVANYSKELLVVAIGSACAELCIEAVMLNIHAQQWPM